VKLLLDTHAWLWFATDDPKLSAAALAEIGNTANEIFVSPASFWEIAIKVSLGRYPLSVPFPTFLHHAIDGNGFQVLPISLGHAAKVATLPFHHRDPFDRLIVAQSLVEDWPVVSCDAALDGYGVRLTW